MILEAAVGNNDTAQHGGCRVVVCPLPVTTNALKGHTTSDGDLLGRCEIPQDALGGNGVLRLSLVVATALVPTGDFLTIPPEAPAGVELNRGPLFIDDVDDHGGATGILLKLKSTPR